MELIYKLTVDHYLEITYLRRTFRPSPGASTSGVKDLLKQFDEVLQPTDDVGDMIQEFTTTRNKKNS